MNTIGQNLRSARKAKGLTQKELSAISGVPYTSIGSYERDDVAPGIFNLIDLAEVLDVSLDRLAGRTDHRGH